MKVIVTGGCGFIGSHLVEALLKEGHEVSVIDSLITGKRENLALLPHQERLKIHEFDLSKRGPWEELFADTPWVVHLAALIDILVSLDQPRAFFENNVCSTLNVIEACRAHKTQRAIYLNSGACYGIADSYPTREDATPKPQYPYALMKLMGEQLFMHWAMVYQVPALSLRVFNLYGPRCGALFGNFMEKLRTGKPLTITGDGSQSRDFTYISDVISAILCALKSDKAGEIYNIGSGTTVPVKRVAELLGASITYIPRRAGEMQVTYGDISKARRDLNWEPKVSIEEGVKSMLQYAGKA